MGKILSIIIPSRCEEFLQQTIDDIFLHSELGNDMEVLVGLDGWFPKKENGTYDLELKDWAAEFKFSPRIKLFHNLEPIGQRAMQNKLIRYSDAKYIMKLDAHVSMSQGFDKVMVEIMEANPNIVLVPALGNLHVYDWICPLKHRTYQGKKDKCEQCGDSNLKKELVWEISSKLYSDFYFDKDLIFQFGDPERFDMLGEVKGVQGSGFMVSRENYWKWNLCDESWGSWGQQGYEVYKKTIKNGGKVFCTRKSFMGHFFRKIDEFPYERDQKQINMAYQKSKELFENKI